MNKSTKIKIIAIAICIALIAALICVAIVIENKQNMIAVGDDVILNDDVHELPKNIVFAVADNSAGVKPVAEKSVNLTATVKPDDASNKALKWSVSWQNPESTWASGKNVNDYLTITTNGFVATLTCKAAFGEKANVIAQAVDNENAKATCVIDYMSDFRVKYEFYFNNNGTPEKFAETSRDKSGMGALPDYDENGICLHNPDIKLVNFNMPENGGTDILHSDYWIKLVPDFTVGTVKPTVTMPTNMVMKNLSVSFKKLIADKYQHVFDDYDNFSAVDYSDGYFKISTFLLYVYIERNLNAAAGFTMQSFVRESYNNCSMNFTFTDRGSYVGAGGVTGSFLPSICAGIDETTCKYFRVNTVSFDNDNIVFG